MQYEIKEYIDGGVRITTEDERWYRKKDSGAYLPSVTWLAGFYPKGKFFEQYLKTKGDEADVILEEAGDRGSRIHAALEDLLNGEEVSIDKPYHSKLTGEEKDLTADEWEAIISFRDWFKVTKPKVISVESEAYYDPDERFSHGYAGTVDLVCEIGGEKWIVDFKTSKDIHDSHKIQLTAYRHALGEHKIAILQVGYKRNKKRWKFTEIEPDMDGLDLSYKIWSREVKKKHPLQRSYPLTIKLNENTKRGKNSRKDVPNKKSK